MRKLAVALMAAAAPFLAAGAANAQSAGTSQTSVGDTPVTGVTVQAPERLVCRQVTRTATRMRTSRVCRTVSQANADNRSRTQDELLADAADTLDVLGADDISTNCVGNPLDRTPDTPLGPR